MLILSRRPDEVVDIGIAEDQVKVRVLSVNGKQVRLGIEAPEHVKVNREEISERIASQEAVEANGNK